MDTTLIAIITPIITAGSALLAVWLTQRYESKKRESEEKRWYADYFLGRKIDALNNLYVALVDCHTSMNLYGNFTPSTLQEFRDEVASKEDAYLRAKVMASIYLDDEARKIMSNALGGFKQAGMAIYLNLPDDECPANKEIYDKGTRNLDWKLFMDTYQEAVACLENLLNPEVLQIIAR